MKKRGIVGIFIFIVLILSILSISFVSASWFSDLFKGKIITGKVVAENSLVAHYKFENNLDDSSGNANHGTNYGASFADGKSGKAASFDGVNDYASVPDSSNLDLTGPMSIGFWIKTSWWVPTLSTSSIILTKGNYLNGYWFEYYPSGKISFWIYPSSGTTKEAKSAVTIPDGQWHYILGTYNRSIQKVYVDGMLSNTNSFSSTIKTTTNPLSIGKGGFGSGWGKYYFNGQLDEIKIWNYALTEAQVTEEYDSYETCSEKQGIVCTSDQQCTGAIVPTYDTSNCCLGSCITETNECENEGLTCKSSCSGTEEEKPYSCGSGNICCGVKTCTDSDGGIDYYVYGVVKGIDADSPTTAPDYCEGSILREYSCGENPMGNRWNYKWEDYTCPNGCSNGACKSAPTNVTNATTCTDSDGGKDYYVKGHGTGLYPINARNGYFIFRETCLGGCKKTTDEQFDTYYDHCLNSNQLNEAFCSVDGSLQAYGYTCPNGCKDGACVESTTNETKCTDSDGGKDYYVKGEVYSEYTGILEKDSCNIKVEQGGGNYYHSPVNSCIGSNCYISEYYCMDSGYSDIVSPLPECPNGCSDGACIKNPVCPDLINKVKNPSDFVDSGFGYSLSWNNSYEGQMWINGNDYDYTEYYASWYTNYNEKYNQISYDILVFDDQNIDLQAWLKERTNYEVCVLRTYWSENNKEDKVYICNWDILNQQQNLDNYKSKSRDILWTNDNVVVQIYVYSGDSLTDEEVSKIAEKRINDFLNDLKDNQGKYVGWEDFDIDWPLSNQIAKSLSQCSSEIPIGTCDPCWNCKIEPVICPEYGYQTKTCVDYCCEKEKIESRNYCSPGVCSGCYVPRWFDIDRMNLDNTCIPYGFRFNHQIGWDYNLQEFTEEERVSEGSSEGEYSLVILSAEKAILTLYDKNGIGYEYILTPGATVEIIIPNWEMNIEKMTLTVKDIIYQGFVGGERYVDLTIKSLGWTQEADTMNAYCDYNGEIKMQKPDWQECQNSYECESNLCSSRECIGITSMLKEVSMFKSLGVKILCKLADMFGLQDYESCVYEYLGAEPTPATSSGGGSGGGSSA